MSADPVAMIFTTIIPTTTSITIMIMTQEQKGLVSTVLFPTVGISFLGRDR